MYIRHLTIRHFRGFSDLTLKPRGHVLLMGEPGAGRSDVLEAIARILDAEAGRSRNPTELDFHQRRTGEPVDIELILGNLGADLEQHFFDQLELWDTTIDALLAEGDGSIEDENTEFVLRLAYRAEWKAEQERGEEWVYYPKSSDPSSSSFTRLRLADIEELGFVRLSWLGGRILDLGERGGFRRVIEKMTGGDFPAAIRSYEEKAAEGAALLSQSEQMGSAVDSVFAPLIELLGVSSDDLEKIVQFAPEGGSRTGLLRSLGPSIDLGGPEGQLPASRQGSTFASLLRVGELVATLSGTGRLLAIDDMGDGMDPGSAIHLSSVLRRLAAQAWVATRVSAIGEIFDPTEVVRLGRTDAGDRAAYQLPVLTQKEQKSALRQWHLNLLPALTYRSAIVFEGPHDLASYRALAIRLCNEGGIPLPAAQRTVLLMAEATGGGGYANAIKVAQFARTMGIRGVAVVDGDTVAAATNSIDANKDTVDALLRLPDGAAIEFAVVHGVAPDTMKAALLEASQVRGLSLPPEFANLSGTELEKKAISFVKDNALHAGLIDALPFNELPQLLKTVLSEALKAARGEASGFIQL